MNPVYSYFREFTRLARFQMQNISPMRSVWPIIQRSLVKKGEQVPEDLPVWHSAVPLVCSFGSPKNVKLSILDASVSLIILNTLEEISSILTKSDGPSMDSKSMELINSTVESHCEVLTFLLEALTPPETENNADTDCAKLIKHLKKFKSEPKNEKNNTSIGKDVKKISKFIRKSFSSLLNNSNISATIDEFRNLILSFQTLGLFLNLISVSEQFEFSEGTVIDISRNAFQGNSRKLLENLSIFQKNINDMQKDQKLQSYNIFKVLFASLNSKIDEYSTAIKKNPMIPLHSKLVLPEIDNFPIECADVLTNILKTAINHVNIETPVFQQAAQTIYEKAKDQQIQYICSCINFLPEAALGYVALLSALLPFSYSERLPHLISLDQTLQDLFNIIHTKCVKIASPVVVNLPKALQQFVGKYLETPSTLEQFYHSVIALKAIQPHLNGLVENFQLFNTNFDNLNRICNALFIAKAAALRLSAVYLSECAFKFIGNHINISSKTSKSILDSFDVLIKFPNDACDYDEYSKLIETVSTLAELITHTTKQVISSAPVSISDTLTSIGMISQNIEETFSLFESLKNSLSKIEDIPIVATQACLKSAINPMVAQLDNIKQYAQSKPEYAKQALSDMKLLTFQLSQMMDTLENELSDEDEEVISLFHKLKDVSDPSEMIKCSEEILEKLNKVSNKLSEENVDREKIENVSFENMEDLTKALEQISDELSRQATVEWVLSSQNDKSVNKLFVNNTNMVKKFVVSRMKSENRYESVDQILQLPDEKIMNDLPNIASSLTMIYNEAGIPKLNEMSTEILSCEQVGDVKSKLQQIKTFNSKYNPFYKALMALSEELRTTKQECTKEIADLCNLYNYQLPVVNSGDLREKSLHQISILIATLVCEERNYSKEYVNQMLQKIENATDISSYVHNVLSTFICSAVKSGCFSDQIITKSYNLMNAYSAYESSPTVTSKKLLMQEIANHPIQFTKEGEMNMMFTSLVSLSLASDDFDCDKVRSIIHMLGFENQYVGYYLKDVYEYKQVMPPEETQEMAAFRITGSARKILKGLRKFNRAAEHKEVSIVKDKANSLLNDINDMLKLLEMTEDAKYNEYYQMCDNVRTVVERVVNDVIQGKRDSVSILQSPFTDLANAIREYIGETNASGKTQTPIIEYLTILAEDIQDVSNTVDNDPTEEELSKYPPLKKYSITEFRTVLHHSRAFVVEIKLLITSLIQENVSFDEELEKEYERACNQVRESVQVIYLLSRVLSTEDKSFKQRVILGARRFSAALQVLYSHVQTNGNQKEIYAKLGEIIDTANTHIRSVIDFASQYGVSSSAATSVSNKKTIIDESYEITHEMSIEKMHLMAKIARLKRELDVAINTEKFLSQ
ncbi:hypothetical protein TVAG_487230 [Trichomonas vaginalis G3]|uniref:I/LWEQ domain-containing protein n=1 Tax=Trichomonas vaginalis (strain ATCC PRA-98 / G3) TaxID=412133 RepID=A2DZF1_TRIV3|nr:hypothetical protein TVAGG3_1016760 [Trichomonas vaginalis G3]EAY14280.1 hypothetical protein TVAG_487230 [Trichomonas vaginalis G3]KAI5491859.1 hypothetical protein TVAGG3_1016760 [Trichomonas vaginalis G3]|eukprot:XP_001326503.1 hypothetical protein [Trichomonas vaginalis G3]